MPHTIDYTIERHINQKLKEINDQERSTHVSSGKLTASMLGQPLQWQILKVKGVPTKEVDGYTLRKFKRGKDVEKWLVENLPGLKETQKWVEYRGCVGMVDAIIELSSGVIPLEIKSVTNMKYKNIMADGEADHGHILQACLYALALKNEHFAIVYVASDDYRIHTMVYDTKDYAQEVGDVIARFDKQLATGVIPAFVPVGEWQKNAKYSDYPAWAMLTEEEVNKKYKEEYEK
jgi:CRISPR/Cas system-associated exonuclease Cas4 (RecB family)